MVEVRRDTPRCVLGIGGSAGALRAFEAFFQAIPRDVCAAYVVLQHMDPQQKSLLPELLGRIAPLPVTSARDAQPLRAGHIYVLEAGTTLRVAGGAFVSRSCADLLDRRHPIDIFFGSLATQYGAHAVGVLVSGSGDDGTNGLRKVQEAGGRTLVQAPQEASFSGMPESAIAAGVVDRVMPVAAIAEAVSTFAECAARPQVEVYNGADLAVVTDTLLRLTGHDFSSYKKSTVIRRLERRLHANGLRDLAAYVDLLEHDAAEPRALLRDLLIGVTQFFRDREAFLSLEERVIPRLIAEGRKTGSVRAWIPACSTGEEAYTLAILLRHHQRLADAHMALQIFATDIDRSALEVARRGLYSPASCEFVPTPYLDRYFVKSDRGYQAAQEIREICIFSEHSILKNPPFSRIDLLSCRNLFIYWEPELQGKVIPLFHYALNATGFLLLGPAENLSSGNELFITLDKKHRIFQKVSIPQRGHVDFPVNAAAPRGYMPDGLSKPLTWGERDPGKLIVSLLLETFVPPAFVVREHGDIAFYSGRMGRFLEPTTGVPRNNLFDVVNKALRPDLHALLHRCVKTKEEVVHPGVAVEREDAVDVVRLTLRPLSEVSDDHGLYLVILQEVLSLTSRDEALRRGIALPDRSPLVHDLQEQLKDTREHLQATVEEVKSSNEELLSMNEELQSANEELQTSKEELQSTNEELQTVNAELSRKVEELDASNSDLQNFFRSAHMPILFLDREFRIQKFTPATTRILRLIPGDLGRHISDISPLVDDLNFASDCLQVLQTLQPLQKELRSKDLSTWYIMRVSPYRTVNDVIAGLIVTFSDVTQIKHVQEAKHELAAIVESSADAIIGKDLRGVIKHWNAGAAEMFGYTANEMIGQSITKLIPSARRDEEAMFIATILRGERIQNYATERLTKNGTLIQVSISVSPVLGADGTIVGAAKIARDITHIKQTERALSAAIRARDEFLSVASHELKTPLTSLRLQVQMRKRNLLGGVPDAFTPEKLQRMLDGDEHQLCRLSRLIDDMLDISRIAGGRLSLACEPADLTVIAREVADRFLDQLASAGCTLTFASTLPVEGEWDRFRLEQVVANLFTNAMKYGAGRPVTVRTELDGDTARLIMEDCGRGIAPADHERIFWQFERVVPPKGVSGLGLGLFIAQQIVKAHGGRIDVRSELGKGATFTVSLPLRSTPSDPKPGALVEGDAGVAVSVPR